METVGSQNVQQVPGYQGTYYFTAEATKADNNKQSSEYYRVVEINNNFKITIQTEPT